METLGQFLKREREFRGISLGQLSEVTKLTKTVLSNIEKDEFHALPQGIFLRGYIKSYCQNVGLNADEVLGRHDFLAKEAKKSEALTYESKPAELQRSSKQGLWIILFVIALIALATFLSSR